MDETKVSKNWPRYSLHVVRLDEVFNKTKKGTPPKASLFLVREKLKVRVHFFNDFVLVLSIDSFFTTRLRSFWSKEHIYIFFLSCLFWLLSTERIDSFIFSCLTRHVIHPRTNVEKFPSILLLLPSLLPFPSPSHILHRFHVVCERENSLTFLSPETNESNSQPRLSAFKIESS